MHAFIRTSVAMAILVFAVNVNAVYAAGSGNPNVVVLAAAGTVASAPATGAC